MQEATALEIARRFNLELTPAEQHDVGKLLTDNAAAYDAYLKGMSLYERWGKQVNLERAVEQFELAQLQQKASRVKKLLVTRLPGAFFERLVLSWRRQSMTSRNCFLANQLLQRSSNRYNKNGMHSLRDWNYLPTKNTHWLTQNRTLQWPRHEPTRLAWQLKGLSFVYSA